MYAPPVLSRASWRAEGVNPSKPRAYIISVLAYVTGGEKELVYGIQDAEEENPTKLLSLLPVIVILTYIYVWRWRGCFRSIEPHGDPTTTTTTTTTTTATITYPIGA